MSDPASLQRDCLPHSYSPYTSTHNGSDHNLYNPFTANTLIHSSGNERMLKRPAALLKAWVIIDRLIPGDQFFPPFIIFTIAGSLMTEK